MKSFKFSETVGAAQTAMLNSDLSEIERKLDDRQAGDGEKAEMDQERHRLEQAIANLDREY